MKKLTSVYAIFLITVVLVMINFWILPKYNVRNSRIITSDALGYYLLLPAIFIYDDVKKMEWLEPVVDQYKSTSHIYQINPAGNGNRVMKYLSGVSILYSPFFLFGHLIANITEYNADGFSKPYQLAIVLASLFYAVLGLILLRKVLLTFFKDGVVCWALILVALAPNYPQYVSIESGMSHGFIFTLYALILWLTIKWHQQPQKRIAFFIGLVLGLAMISRPTEIIMLFIPLLCLMAPVGQSKWPLVSQYKHHILWTGIGGITGVMPQLVYWKYVTGQWIYDVGSKWDFFDPHWQVLFGWEKGWFVYTPVTIAMIIGFYFLRKNPLYVASLVFTLLNIWIVIAWSDWHYGASYSCRALIQSYPVLALPLAALIDVILNKKWKSVFYAICILLCTINIFQIWQYNQTIIHYRDMNRLAYAAVLLDPFPDAVDMSMLDTDEKIRSPRHYSVISEMAVDTIYNTTTGEPDTIVMLTISKSAFKEANWAVVKTEVKSHEGAFGSYLVTSRPCN